MAHTLSPWRSNRAFLFLFLQLSFFILVLWRELCQCVNTNTHIDMWCWRWPVQSEKGVPVEGVKPTDLYTVWTPCCSLHIFKAWCLLHCQKSVNAPQRKKHQHSLVFLSDTTHMLTCLDLTWLSYIRKKVCICNTMPNQSTCNLLQSVH